MRRLTWVVLLLGIATMLALLAPRVSRADDPAPQTQTEKPQPEPAQVYSVQYNIYEVDNGKRTNSRTYRVMVAIPARDPGRVYQTPWRGSIRVGNRVPYISHSGGQAGADFGYEDVGMNIDCSLLDVPPTQGNALLTTSIKWWTVTGKDTVTGNPLLRNLEFSEPALVPLDKPTVIGAVDDVNSDHQYQIEVTVKKVE